MTSISRVYTPPPTGQCSPVSAASSAIYLSVLIIRLVTCRRIAFLRVRASPAPRPTPFLARGPCHSTTVLCDFVPGHNAQTSRKRLHAILMGTEIELAPRKLHYRGMTYGRMQRDSVWTFEHRVCFQCRVTRCRCSCCSSGDDTVKIDLCLCDLYDSR